MRALTAQAGIPGRVIDLHGATWREDRASCCEDCAGFDRWAASLGGYASARYRALYAEALEFAGPDRCAEYLNTARAIDEGNVIEMAFGQEQASAQRTGGAEMVRELVRRLDAAAATRERRSAEIRLAQDQAAIEECLERVDEAQRAMDQLRADPRAARILDNSLSDTLEDPGMSPVEVAAEMRARLGLMPRPQTRYEAEMPPVSDLARQIGIRW